jgi:hypothetical protein
MEVQDGLNLELFLTRSFSKNRNERKIAKFRKGKFYLRPLRETLRSLWFRILLPDELASGRC